MSIGEELVAAVSTRTHSAHGRFSFFLFEEGAWVERAATETWVLLIFCFFLSSFGIVFFLG